MDGKRNIAVMISFLGTRLHGFQRQKNAVSIQEIIEDALLEILGQKTVIYGCSRTDTGVSAKEYVFNFTTDNRISLKKIKTALNHFLPDEIAVHKVAEVGGDFHARYCTREKEYVYIIRNSRQKDPFTEGRVFRYPNGIIDEELLDDAAKAFVGKHDFSAFCSMHDGAKSHERTVTLARVERQGEDVIFTFRADGFLYNMVRIMVGTLLFVNEGKIPPDKIGEIIESKDRKRAGATAKACGLYLNRVIYENDPFKNAEGSESIWQK